MTDDKALEAARQAIRYLSHPETPWSDEQVQAVISAYLSALPGEAEVVEFRGDAEKIRWLSAERERLIKDAVNVATQRNELLLSLQAMQARAEAAERELSNMLHGVSDEES
jgi:hypothetical protein